MGQEDPLDSLLGLEDSFYEEGYRLGVEDGARSGRIEGRAFGLEKGFEKFLEMGRLHGRTAVWASRISRDIPEQSCTDTATLSTCAQARIPQSARLEKHIQMLYALVEPDTISTENNEEAVSEFDDRLKRAKAKSRIIERAAGDRAIDESDFQSRGHQTRRQEDAPENGEGNIEDIGGHERLTQQF